MSGTCDTYKRKKPLLTGCPESTACVLPRQNKKKTQQNPQNHLIFPLKQKSIWPLLDFLAKNKQTKNKQTNWQFQKPDISFVYLIVTYLIIVCLSSLPRYLKSLVLLHQKVVFWADIPEVQTWFTPERRSHCAFLNLAGKEWVVGDPVQLPCILALSTWALPA